MVIKTYLPSNLCDSSDSSDSCDGCDSSDCSDSSDSGDSSDQKNFFFLQKNFLSQKCFVSSFFFVLKKCFSKKL